MQVQRIQNNNYNTSFGALIFDKSMESTLNRLSLKELQEIKKIRESLKDTKYYDLLVRNNSITEYIVPKFIPKNKNGVELDCILCKGTTMLLKDENGYETKLDWRKTGFGYSRHLTTFDFESSADAKKAKEIVNNAENSVQTFDSFARDAYENLIPAIKNWADICTNVLEKSLAFKESGKPKILSQKEKLIGNLVSNKVEA